MFTEFMAGTFVGVVHSSPAARAHKQSSQAHASSWSGSLQAKVAAVVGDAVVLDAAAAIVMGMYSGAVADTTGGVLTVLPVGAAPAVVAVMPVGAGHSTDESP
jgi:hypothetical protein